MVKNRDQIYTAPQTEIGKFVFDDKVASVFEDMISRSVPGYGQILQLLPTLIRQFHRNDSQYYDLGCSLGAGVQAMAKGLHDIPDVRARIIGIDSSPEMLSKAEPLLKSIPRAHIDIELRQADITRIKVEQAAVVLMNFTLQFIPLHQRDQLIHSIYAGMHHDGALIISEKIKFDAPLTNQTMINIHHQFKADQGYSELEISQKRDAIENVLIPETLGAHIDRLDAAGFKVVTPWIQNLQFISILAVK